MCCDGWYPEEGEEVNGVCPDCGGDTIDGSAPYGCYYSPVVCETCGDRPCDESC